MIPKVIHYVWLGKNKKPALVVKCIKSWEINCPNYKIVEWNENNFPIDKFRFTKEAYEAQKYAFCSDLIRLFVLKEYGGIYLDTDMELLKPIDHLLNNQAFCGFENKEYASCGIIGAEANNDHITKLYNFYKNKSFLIANGKMNLISIPLNFTNYLVGLGLKQNGLTQCINGFKVYSSDYFYPKEYESSTINYTNNTIAIHHWAVSWFSKKERKNHKIKTFINDHKFLKKCDSLIRKILHK